MTMPPCRACPIRVDEQHLFVARHRCGIHGRYVRLDAPCGITGEEAAAAKQFLSRVLVSKISE